ncbi:putative cuticle protein CPH38 [Operophtera brumata]|nr:putative cuticle protein CPH38 [Operophtera brumata]KOB71377.1 putative cuticle protein CPH38 [Operophtera brumata]KOB71379.1 putative cuticle protein CPH38 [Operophtera brumata]
MKFIVAFVAIVAVAVANPVKPATNELAELEAIIAAIQSPSTDPATAALLEEQLASIIAETSPIAVGPAIVETSPISVGPAIIESSPISVGPAIIDFPLPDGGLVTAEEPTPVAVIEPTPVQPSPVVIGEIPAGSSPLVQIIVNVNQAESGVAPAPVVAPEAVQEVIVPGPVNIVDGADVIIPAPVVVDEVYQPGPVNVVDHIVVEPVQVVNPVVVEPVQVVSPVVVEPVIVGTPIIPTPAVVLPETLN